MARALMHDVVRGASARTKRQSNKIWLYLYSNIGIKAYYRYVQKHMICFWYVKFFLISEGVTFLVTKDILQGKGLFLGAELPTKKRR